MTRLASRFGQVNSVRRDRPLTQDELPLWQYAQGTDDTE